MEVNNDIRVLHTEAKDIYIIEGVDGSGKSTVGPLVAEKISGVFYEYPLAFKPGIESIDKYADITARLFFFLGYNLQVSSDISQLSLIKPVVCARYIYSTLAYHIVKGVNKQWAFDIANKLSLISPTKVFFLDVTDKSIQMKRLLGRGLLEEDEKMYQKTEELRTIYLEMGNTIPGFTYIDTTNISQKEVVEKIVKSIQTKIN